MNAKCYCGIVQGYTQALIELTQGEDCVAGVADDEALHNKEECGGDQTAVASSDTLFQVCNEGKTCVVREGGRKGERKKEGG